jgi:hypothetical protein
MAAKAAIHDFLSKSSKALLFVNKKKQKNFSNLDRAGETARGPDS